MNARNAARPDSFSPAPDPEEKPMTPSAVKVEILAICAAVAVMTGVLAVVW
jgi:hypothetical protein